MKPPVTLVAAHPLLCGLGVLIIPIYYTADVTGVGLPLCWPGCLLGRLLGLLLSTSNIIEMFGAGELVAGGFRPFSNPSLPLWDGDQVNEGH